MTGMFPQTSKLPTSIAFPLLLKSNILFVTLKRLGCYCGAISFEIFRLNLLPKLAGVEFKTHPSRLKIISSNYLV